MPYGSTYDEAWLAQQLQKPGYRLLQGTRPDKAPRRLQEPRREQEGGRQGVGDDRALVAPATTENALLAASASEADLLTRVRTLARLQGYLVYHTWRSDHSEAGFPDLVLVKPGREEKAGRLIFAELKSRRGKLSPAQHTWLDLLGHTLPGVEVYTWRPADWPAITAILTRKDTP